MVKKIFVLICSILITNVSQAKLINFYNQPMDNAKILGSMDSEAGVITIFTPKDSQWIKVADPRNGNVGWIKSSDLNVSGVSYNVITTGNGKQNYQVIQFGTGPSMSPEEVAQMTKQIQRRQEAIQKNMQQMVRDMFNDPFWGSKPLIMPIVVMPEQPLKPLNGKIQVEPQPAKTAK